MIGLATDTFFSPELLGGDADAGAFSGLIVARATRISVEYAGRNSSRQGARRLPGLPPVATFHP